MSKLLAAFYGHKSINKPQEPKPKEYTVLGINQPLIAPQSEPAPLVELQPTFVSVRRNAQRKFGLSLLLNKLL